MEKAVAEAAPRLIDTYGVAVGILVMLLIVAVCALWVAFRGSLKDLAAANKQNAELAERAIKGLEASRSAIENATRAIEDAGEASAAGRAAITALAAASLSLEKSVERIMVRVERAT